VSEACGTNIEDFAVDRGHRTLRIMGKGSKPAVIPLVSRAARTLDLVIGERSEGPILRRQDGHRLDRRTAHRWVRSIGKRAGLGVVYPHMLRAAFMMAALAAAVPIRDVQIAARHADPRTTTIYDRRRENFDRHAAYVVVAFVAGGERILGSGVALTRSRQQAPATRVAGSCDPLPAVGDTAFTAKQLSILGHPG
jgi:integrase/recombinase XerD